MQPNVTRRNTWAQIGIGAGALLLPPLALGAVFYSMLAAPDDGTSPRANAPAALRDRPAAAAVIAQPAKAEPVARTPAETSAADAARMWDQASGQGRPVQTTSGQATSGEATSGQVGSVQVASFPVAVLPGAATNPRTAGAAPPAVDGPPAPAAPKRAARRHMQRQPQEEYPLRNWLQQIGILPRSNTGGG